MTFKKTVELGENVKKGERGARVDYAGSINRDSDSAGDEDGSDFILDNSEVWPIIRTA